MTTHVNGALDIGTVSSREVGAMLYKLVFPNRKFETLPESVQRSYENDGQALLAMLRQAAT